MIEIEKSGIEVLGVIADRILCYTVIRVWFPKEGGTEEPILSEVSTKKQIDYRFKLLYAIGMIMIVCSHAQGGSISFELNGWFPYGGLHVMLFVFGSGYFYKEESIQHVMKQIGRKIKKLIIPLYLYNFAYGLLVWLLRFKGFQIGEIPSLYTLLVAPITSGHQFMYNLAGWFVAPLFMAEIFYLLIRKALAIINKKIPEWVYFTIGMVAGITGSQLACLSYNTGWWLVLVRMLYFTFFYSLGVFYKTTLETYDKKIPSFWYIACIFVLKLAIICICRKSPDYVLSWCNNFTEGPIIPIVASVLGIALWFRIATILTPVIGRSKYVNLIANNTYSIMMNQFFGFMVLKTCFVILALTIGVFADFDMVSYKTDVWWLYLPHGIEQMRILYVIAGIVIPIYMQRGIDAGKRQVQRIFERKIQTV